MALPDSPANAPQWAPAQAALRRMESVLRLQRYSPRTLEAYLSWVRRFLRFHRGRDPRRLDAESARAFLSALAERGKVSASTQNQARSALVFFHKHVLRAPLPILEGVTPASRPRRLPVVLSREEVAAVLGQLRGAKQLVAMLLYGSGLRLMEALHLRVKDIDAGRSQVIVRSGKGDKDRVTVLPKVLEAPLRRHLERVKRLHERDLARGAGNVVLPGALSRKAPGAARAWEWQWVLPATTKSGTRRPVSGDGIIFTNPPSSARYGRRCCGRVLRSARRATPCVTHLPRTCWSKARTYVPSRSSSGTPISRPQ
jgi:integron integrase